MFFFVIDPLDDKNDVREKIQELVKEKKCDRYDFSSVLVKDFEFVRVSIRMLGYLMVMCPMILMVY